MDLADMATPATEEATNEAIARIRVEARTQAYTVTGFCLNRCCGDESPGRPFCSAVCRNEYDAYKKLVNRR